MTLPLSHEALAALSYQGTAHGVTFTCQPCNRPRDKMAIQIVGASPDGFKGPAQRLLDALNARWRHRGGYALAPSRATLWRKLFIAGWDAEMDWRGAYGHTEAPKLEAPDGRKMTLREAEREITL